MIRDDKGELIRDISNPHGLPPMITAEERARRLDRLTAARDTAWAAADKVEAVRLANVRAEPVELAPIQWWGV